MKSAWTALGLTALLLLGCGGTGQAVKNTEAPLVAAPLPPAPPPEAGSLWQGRDGNGLVADNRARHVGDVVTISITETAKASEIANTDASKTSGVKTSIGSLLGLTFPLKAFNKKNVDVDTAVEASVGNTSKGEGKTERQSTFTSYLTARVVQVLPNQALVVKGQRQMRINNETEVIIVSGIVNPKDLDRNNTIPSTKLAEARLEISGVGVVSDKQRQGWATRILDHIWPF